MQPFFVRLRLEPVSKAEFERISQLPAQVQLGPTRPSISSSQYFQTFGDGRVIKLPLPEIHGRRTRNGPVKVQIAGFKDGLFQVVIWSNPCPLTREFLRADTFEVKVHYLSDLDVKRVQAGTQAYRGTIERYPDRETLIRSGRRGLAIAEELFESVFKLDSKRQRCEYAYLMPLFAISWSFNMIETSPVQPKDLATPRVKSTTQVPYNMAPRGPTIATHKSQPSRTAAISRRASRNQHLIVIPSWGEESNAALLSDSDVEDVFDNSFPSDADDMMDDEANIPLLPDNGFPSDADDMMDDLPIRSHRNNHQRHSEASAASSRRNAQGTSSPSTGLKVRDQRGSSLHRRGQSTAAVRFKGEAKEAVRWEPNSRSSEASSPTMHGALFQMGGMDSSPPRWRDDRLDIDPGRRRMLESEYPTPIGSSQQSPETPRHAPQCDYYTGSGSKNGNPNAIPLGNQRWGGSSQSAQIRGVNDAPITPQPDRAGNDSGERRGGGGKRKWEATRGSSSNRDEYDFNGPRGKRWPHRQ
ncbi:hypothetical protein GGS20DRAFT_573029 [Poronia punctata]|nr:hypothetical protein GGS20DRAFT_573029 [Poronia punctata]